MAEQKPLVLEAGVLKELQTANTLARHVAVSSESTTTTVKVAVVEDLPETPDPNTLYLVTG